MSRPGRTTAPRGCLAIAASNIAVAGMEPVEPAAITGASDAASRAVSAAINLSRRSAGSMAARSFRICGQVLRKICRRPSDFCQYSSRSGRSARTNSSILSQPTSRVVMSSISRARSSASAIAAAGVLATSGVPAAPCRSGELAHLTINSASSSRRSKDDNVSGKSSAVCASSPLAACAKINSSSSISPMATMRGRMAASPATWSRNSSRTRRQARRVGR